MSSMYYDTAQYDDAEGEAAEYDDSEAGEFAESPWDTDFEGDDYDAESPTVRRRRAQAAQRVAQARRRRAQLRARATARPGPVARPTPGRVTTPTTRSTVAAIRNVDLDSKVAEDNLRRGLASQGRRMSRSEYAAVAGAAVNQFIDSFKQPENAYAKAALRFSPLLLLSPQSRGAGLEGVVKDPRVVGAAAVAGIVLLSENRNRFTGARDIAIQGPSDLTKGTKDLLIADVRDGRGKVLTSAPVRWTSSDDSIAKINEVTGELEAFKAGTVIVTAESDGAIRRIRVRVT